MAINREKQQNTLANRIRVVRGRGLDQAISSANNESRVVEATINNISNVAQDYLTTQNTAKGKKMAREQEFGAKTITYTDNNGAQHNMEMVVPVEAPEFQSRSAQEAYDAINMVMYNDAVKTSLQGIVDMTSTEALDAGSSVQEFQSLVENKTSIYIDELPQGYQQVAKTHVADRLALKAPNVHKGFVVRRNAESELNITKMTNNVSAEAFESALMGNEYNLERLRTKYDEASLLIDASGHYTSDAHKQSAIKELQSDYKLNKAILDMFGNSLSHDPSDSNTGYDMQTKTNLNALYNLLTNPSQSSVAITMDDGSTKTVTRKELRDTVPPEDWYQLSDKKAKQLKPLITANASNTKKRQKIDEIKFDLNNRVYNQKDAKHIFGNPELLNILKTEYSEETGRVADDDPQHFQIWTMRERNGLMNDVGYRKIKQLLNNPTRGNADETTLIYMEMVNQSGHNAKELLKLSDAENGVLMNIKNNMQNGMTFPDAVREVQDIKQQVAEMKDNNAPDLTNRLSKADVSDLETPKKLSEFIKNEIIEFNDSFGNMFFTDQDTVVSLDAVREIENEVKAMVMSGNVDKDNIRDIIEIRMQEIADGRDPKYGYSFSTASRIVGVGEDLLDVHIVSNRAEYPYGIDINGEQRVDYILPFIKEKIAKSRLKSETFSVPTGMEKIGESFEESNVRLQIEQRGVNPSYHLSYVSDFEIRKMHSDFGRLIITKEDFARERKLYKDYQRIAVDQTFSEWRKANVD
jgi:hypothetical protein